MISTSFLNRDELSLSFCILAVAYSGCLSSHFSLTRFMNPLSFFLINNYQTNFYSCIPFSILLHFCCLVSHYFSSPSFFFKVAGVVYQILSCSSFFWKFNLPPLIGLLSSSWFIFSFRRSSKFIHTICLFSLSICSLLFIVWKLLCSMRPALFAACCTTVTLASSKNVIGWNWLFWSISPIKSVINAPFLSSSRVVQLSG